MIPDDSNGKIYGFFSWTKIGASVLFRELLDSKGRSGSVLNTSEMCSGFGDLPQIGTSNCFGMTTTTVRNRSFG